MPNPYILANPHILANPWWEDIPSWCIVSATQPPLTVDRAACESPIKGYPVRRRGNPCHTNNFLAAVVRQSIQQWVIELQTLCCTIFTLSIMFGFSSSKSKPSSKSKSNRHRNKQGRNDQGRDDQGRDDQGDNDQGWSEWEYSEDYRQEWRDRIGPNGMCI
jgi:hypothetical protein